MSRNAINSREWAHAVLSTVYEAVIVIDDKLRISFANDAAAAMLQASRPLLLGHYVWNVLPIYRNDQQITEEQYRRALDSQDFSSLTGPMVLMHEQNLLLVNVTTTFLPQFGQTVFVFEDDKRIQLALEQQERKTAETSQQKIRSILESIRDAFFALDSSWRFTYINAQADPFFEGKTRRNLIGKVIWDEFPQLKETQLYTKSIEVAKTSETQTFQEFHKHADAWLEFQLYPARDGLSVYFRDITSAKIAEERTFVQYEITRLLAAATSIESTLPKALAVLGENLHWQWGAYWAAGKEKNRLSLLACWNAPGIESFRHFCERYKIKKGVGLAGLAWEREESIWAANFMKYKHFARRFEANKVGLHTALVIPTFRSGELLGVLELFQIPKRREDKPFLSFMNALANQIGQFVQRKYAEAEAKTSEERFRLLVSGAQDYVMMTLDATGRIESWNEGGERLLGYKEQEVLGKNFSLFFTEVDKKENKPAAELHRAIETGKSLDEGELVRKDGTKFWASGTTTAMRDDANNLQGLVKIAKDETARRELEARKDEFISMASHELKTPVTSVKVFTQILQKRLKDHSDPEINRFLKKMDGQLDKLTKLISDLLNLSKIQAGKLEFQWGEVDIDELVADTVENLQATSQRYQFNLTGFVGQKISGDRDRIGQVLINLLTNAMKYSADATAIEVTAAQQDGFATISVRDFGIGIEKKHQRKIFDRFYQAHKESQNFPGLGIGLYISREIARRHNGDIKVESKKGKGSIFTLFLPILHTKS